MNKSSDSLRRMMPALVLAVIWWPQGLNAAEHAIGQCAGNYVGCLEDWKQQRLNFLKGADGYLNLAGLYWLKEGDNTFGSSSSSDFIFPDRAGAELGTFNLENGQVTMVVNTRNDVRVGERRVSRIIMRDDTATSPTIASHGSLQWIVIRRDEQFAVRVRDFSHPALENFAPIESYPADEAFRVTATLHPYPERRIVRVDTVIAGLDYNPWAPGGARFELDGQAYELEAYDAGPELFFVFGDLTSGRETYPAGRFLYAAKPGDDGVFTLDFNTAHNPPCAFNEFATCPVASPRNRLPVRIPAGEKFDPATH